MIQSRRLSKSEIKALKNQAKKAGDKGFKNKNIYNSTLKPANMDRWGNVYHFSHLKELLNS